MLLSRLLTDFSLSAGVGQEGGEFVLNEKVEELRLQSYEDGYQAGWEDAMRAQKDINSHISKDFESGLQEASFAFHEARTALTKTLEHVFVPIIEQLLPSLARNVVAQHVVEQIKGLARDQLDRRIEVVVSASNQPAIKKLLSASLQAPFQLVSDPQLSDGQVFLRVDDEEREVNLDTAIAEIGDAVASFFEDARKE
ncbi:MAG: hypothetical protein AAF088_21485, partial [Pseudomonadota bacterium]